MKLTERDREVLNELCGCHDAQYPIQWARPLDVGGHNGSDHSYRLSKLARLGFAEERQRGCLGQSRGSKEYRITDAGRAALTPQQGEPGE